MIRINNQKVDINHFPDGTLLLKEIFVTTTQSEQTDTAIELTWNYENNEELYQYKKQYLDKFFE